MNAAPTAACGVIVGAGLALLTLTALAAPSRHPDHGPGTAQKASSTAAPK